MLIAKLIVATLSIAAIGAYFLFNDTLNRIQYIERLRVYWITRDTGTEGTPFISRAWMRQTAEPYWRGHGIQFRVGQYTFQVGKLDDKAESLSAQISNAPSVFDSLTPKDIRQWRK